MSDLPQGWVKASLEALVQPKSERVSPAEHAQARYIGLEHVEAHTNSLIGTAHASSVSSSSAAFVAGDVLYGRMRPYLNKVVRPNFDGLASAEFIVFPENAALDSEFLLKRISSSDFVQFACSQYEGDRPRVKFDQLGKFIVDVPPRAEQIRIVAKLEELLSDLDAGVAELKAAQKKLQQYRQSLLKAAVEGALTADWREAQRQQGTPTENGAQLLARILTERRARWEAKQLARFKEQGKAPPKDWQKKYPEPVRPDTTELPDLPKGWVWASADQLVAESSYGTSVKCSYESRGTPVLRIPNVSAGSLDLEDMKFAVEDPVLEENYYLAVGDVLVIRTNGSIGLVGRAAAVTSDLPSPHYFASYLVRLRTVETTSVHRWLLASLSAQAGRQWLERRAASSAGQHNISLSTLLRIPIPLPSIQEQAKVLDELETRYQLIEEQATATDRSLLQTNAQRQNILRAAFAGQLVAQDHDDEPAEVLLDRIRNEGAERANQPKTRRLKRYAEA